MEQTVNKGLRQGDKNYNEVNRYSDNDKAWFDFLLVYT